MTAPTGGSPFWQFSLATYARPGVSEACLALQERHGLDVNLLLFCVFAGTRGRRLTADELAVLEAATADWQARVVQPLRAVRRWLKTQECAPQAAAAELRAGVKARELEAEAVEQRILATALAIDDAAAGAPQDAAANLRAYFARLGREPGVADAAELAQILTGAFGESLRPLDAVWQVQGLESA